MFLRYQHADYESCNTTFSNMTTDKARSLTEQIETSVNQLASETDAARQSELFKSCPAKQLFEDPKVGHSVLPSAMTGSRRARTQPSCPRRFSG
jgi:hypothetical protein